MNANFPNSHGLQNENCQWFRFTYRNAGLANSDDWYEFTNDYRAATTWCSKESAFDAATIIAKDGGPKLVPCYHP